jgi:hypothetical protein
MLSELAEAEGVDPGAMLGLVIARGWYLRSVIDSGGRLFVKRGRRFYRLEQGPRALGSRAARH